LSPPLPSPFCRFREGSPNRNLRWQTWLGYALGTRNRWSWQSEPSPLSSPSILGGRGRGTNRHSGISCASRARCFSNRPLIVRHVEIRDGNRCGCHRRSWVWNRWDASLRLAGKWHPGLDFERFKFRGAVRCLAAMRQLLAGLAREPARLKMAGDTPRY
jgi:hypothetical protein